ncbi:hypothetical protein ACFFX0_29070 [Citricoccus parietis]|uniref:Uncharacterized protein n=1 Tax=Citricoccus parietis TaxID=592307 RepID=A0ABV5G655_9MICC
MRQFAPYRNSAALSRAGRTSRSAPWCQTCDDKSCVPERRADWDVYVILLCALTEARTGGQR